MLKRSFGKLILASALLSFTACSADRGNPKPQLRPDVTYANDADPADTGDFDSGMMSSPDQGMMSSVDTGLLLSAACMELEDCCNELPGQIRPQCLSRVEANIDTDCLSTLQMVQGFGYCLPPGHDAGMRGDTGPLRPRCEALLACCAEIPIAFLRTQCEDAAMDNDEANCDMRISQAQSAGICLDPPDSGMADAGTSTTSMDAGTSTTGMDAGTSTVADGG